MEVVERAVVVVPQESARHRCCSHVLTKLGRYMGADPMASSWVKLRPADTESKVTDKLREKLRKFSKSIGTRVEPKTKKIPLGVRVL